MVDMENKFELSMRRHYWIVVEITSTYFKDKSIRRNTKEVRNHIELSIIGCVIKEIKYKIKICDTSKTIKRTNKDKKERKKEESELIKTQTKQKRENRKRHT